MAILSLKKIQNLFFSVTSGEKGGTITVIICCNAEDIFLSLACIMKGKNKKPKFEDSRLSSVVYMSQKSAYITRQCFLTGLECIFFLENKVGTVALILDGHSFHCNSIKMLEFVQSERILLILSSQSCDILFTVFRSYCF